MGSLKVIAPRGESLWRWRGLDTLAAFAFAIAMGAGVVDFTLLSWPKEVPQFELYLVKMPRGVYVVTVILHLYRSVGSIDGWGIC
jgi:hypothetical protein